MEMKAKARRLKLERHLDIVFVDYIQLMRAGGRFENRNQEMSFISRSLKELAKELQIPVVGISQLSRAPGKGPRASPGRSSPTCANRAPSSRTPTSSSSSTAPEMYMSGGTEADATWRAWPRSTSPSSGTGRRTLFKLAFHRQVRHASPTPTGFPISKPEVRR